MLLVQLPYCIWHFPTTNFLLCYLFILIHCSQFRLRAGKVDRYERLFCDNFCDAKSGNCYLLLLFDKLIQLLLKESAMLL